MAGRCVNERKSQRKTELLQKLLKSVEKARKVQKLAILGIQKGCSYQNELIGRFLQIHRWSPDNSKRPRLKGSRSAETSKDSPATAAQQRLTTQGVYPIRSRESPRKKHLKGLSSTARSREFYIFEVEQQAATGNQNRGLHHSLVYPDKQQGHFCGTLVQFYIRYKRLSPRWECFSKFVFA
ncbi:hypothetical protein TNCV_3156051 [Trichonephila clavipes]|nr:hypothetical protein TNCV_3156051 [Trichonephila clavipes]